MPLLFVFDMDDVLYDYDWRSRMAGLSASTGHDLAELRRRWWNRDGEWHAEAGGYADGAAYLAAFNAALDADFSRETWLANRGGAMTPWPDSIAVTRRAAELGRVTLLTNNNPLLAEHLPEVARELVPHFEGHLHASCQYGARKPDPVVFERVLEAYGADPADVFFADDLTENVAGARSVGITAHRFEGAAGLRDAVERFAAERG